MASAAPDPAGASDSSSSGGGGRRPSGSSGRERLVRSGLAIAVGIVAVIAGAAPSAASAAGQTYTVLQCHPLNRAHADSILEDAPAYATRGFCGDPQNDHAIKVTSTADAQRPRSGRVRWPTGSRHLALVSVDLQAKLRRDNGHAARVWMADPRQNEVARVATRRPRAHRVPALLLAHAVDTARDSSSRASPARARPAARNQTSRRPGCETSGWRSPTTRIHVLRPGGRAAGRGLASRRRRDFMPSAAIQVAGLPTVIVSGQRGADRHADRRLRFDSGHRLRRSLRSVHAVN